MEYKMILLENYIFNVQLKNDENFGSIIFWEEFTANVTSPDHKHGKSILGCERHFKL